MTLTDFLDTVVAHLSQKFPELASCQTHAGTFDVEELRRFAAATPAMRIACLGISNAEVIATNEREALLQVAAFVITTDRPALPRDRGSLNLVEALAVELPRQRFGLAHAHPAAQVRARNLYGGTLGTTGASIWAVSWEQTLRLGADVWGEAGVLPSELYLGMAPDIGEGHEDDYMLVEELPDVG